MSDASKTSNRATRTQPDGSLGPQLQLHPVR